MLSERGTRDSHKPHPDLAGLLPCGPSALSLLQFTKTAALTLAGERWMDPWPEASCRMLVARSMRRKEVRGEYERNKASEAYCDFASNHRDVRHAPLP
ncbi:hypothetical protein NDU88_009490 [Pleurodeles waltl]|uniref:Uncharacterized protein n=1 Tax=Pleurodeles waltl TaxID=8319 RepID=A0AAV7RXS2_PLEWA|nr:hypothetical protein NDU88_009490 [Pleurodeles waltl]